MPHVLEFKASGHRFNTTELNMQPQVIRNLIDVHGYVALPHQSSVTAQPTLIQGIPQTQSLTLPGSNILVGSGGYTGADWPGLIRFGIDTFFGKNDPVSPFQQPGPLVLPPGSPTPGLFPPGGLTGPLPGGGRGRVQFITMPNGLPGCPSGYHPEKSGQPYCVRNRRMNPLNPRALSRATRRVGGFARAVKRARTIKQVCRSL